MTTQKMQSPFTNPSHWFRCLSFALIAAVATVMSADCPPKISAYEVGPIAPNGPVIAAQCPEACPEGRVGTFIRHEQDASGYDWMDWIVIQCEETEELIYSRPVDPAQSTASTCWNCETGCGLNCPAGESCVPRPNSVGSDCRRFACKTGYRITEEKVDGIPVCVLNSVCPMEPPTEAPLPINLSLEGPSRIRTGTACSWFANAWGGRAYTTKTYTWYVSNNPVGTGEWYTGGRPSGVLVGQSWRLRVNVTDGVTTASRELLVSESSSAPVCAQ